MSGCLPQPKRPPTEHVAGSGCRWAPLHSWHTGSPTYLCHQVTGAWQETFWLQCAILHHKPAAHTSFWGCRQPFGPWDGQFQPAIACLSMLIMLRGRADLKQSAPPWWVKRVLEANGMWVKGPTPFSSHFWALACWAHLPGKLPLWLHHTKERIIACFPK